MDIRLRLLEFIKYLGITNAEFERVCGLSNGFVSQVNNKVRKSSLSMIYNAYPQLNPDWLVSGQGTMVNTPVEKATDLRELLATIARLVAVNDRVTAENTRLQEENSKLNEAIARLSRILEKTTQTSQVG